ncbi:MAG: hypothetical protein FD168_1125 [Desulfobulbaceae bacterium]|nr:MAG: hypothetical protein FD168_1125 [Desulfobulbaceae bacterium]
MPGKVLTSKISCVLLAAAALQACQSLPSRGEHLIMEIRSIPTTRVSLQERPELSLSLMRGVTRNDVTSGRLAFSHCYLENELPLSNLRFGVTLLPEGTKVKPGDIIEIVAEEAVGGKIPFSRFFGRYLAAATSSPSDFFSHGAREHSFRCGPVSPSGNMRVEVVSFAHYWDFDFAQAEESRNSGINAEELHDGRIAIGQCSPGVDSWATWKVRLPPELTVRKGDYIEAIAGSQENSTSVGPISEAVRKVAPPDKKYFIKTQGSNTISCDAPAIPFQN